MMSYDAVSVLTDVSMGTCAQSRPFRSEATQCLLTGLHLGPAVTQTGAGNGAN